jgi:pSer/pThr/pTyr-binding forkhead associated (FHA) protein
LGALVRKKDIFSVNTFISESIEDLVVVKRAVIHAGPVPRLEAHGRSKPLSNKAFSIGRDKHNGVIISDTKVSKLHAMIRFRDGRGFVRDSGSTNGTYVNGTRITPNTDIELSCGDVIIVGATRLTYRC